MQFNRTFSYLDTELLRDIDPVFRGNEVRRSRVEEIERLGSGYFGVVYRGRLRALGDSERFMKVAVKRVKGAQLFVIIVLMIISGIITIMMMIIIIIIVVVIIINIIIIIIPNLVPCSSSWTVLFSSLFSVFTSHLDRQS